MAGRDLEGDTKCSPDRRKEGFCGIFMSRNKVSDGWGCNELALHSSPSLLCNPIRLCCGQEKCGVKTWYSFPGSVMDLHWFRGKKKEKLVFAEGWVHPPGWHVISYHNFSSLSPLLLPSQQLILPTDSHQQISCPIFLPELNGKEGLSPAWSGGTWSFSWKSWIFSLLSPSS